jgi:hypothetical protein
MHCITEWGIRQGTRLTLMEGIHEPIPPPVGGGGTGLRLGGRAGAGAGCSQALAFPPVARRGGRGRRQGRGRGPVVARGAGGRRQQSHDDGASLVARVAMGACARGTARFMLPVRRRRWAEAPRRAPRSASQVRAVRKSGSGPRRVVRPWA